MDEPTELDWRQRAWQELRRLAASGRPFTADDLLQIVGHPDKEHDPNGRNNSIGAVFQRGSTEKLIVAIGVEQSTQPHRKGGMVRVWRGTVRSGTFFG